MVLHHCRASLICLSLLKAQREAPAKESGVPNVSSAKNRLEIVKKQFVSKVLHVELNVHRHALLLPEIRANRKVQDCSRPNAASLEIDLLIETRIKALTDEIGECGAGLYIRRHTRVVPTAESRIEPRSTMVVAQLKLRLISLVMVVGEFETCNLETLRIFADEKTAVDWRDAIGAGIRIRYESMKTPDLS